MEIAAPFGLIKPQARQAERRRAGPVAANDRMAKVTDIVPGPNPQKRAGPGNPARGQQPVSKPESGPNQTLADIRCAGPWVVCGYEYGHGKGRSL